MAPEFALTKWKLGLLYEAMGDVDLARENYLAYQQLTADETGKAEAGLHLATLDSKRLKYNQEVDAAGDIISDLFNRSMNLSFNGSESRSALRVKRARVKKRAMKGKPEAESVALPFLLPTRSNNYRLPVIISRLHWPSFRWVPKPMS